MDAEQNEYIGQLYSKLFRYLKIYAQSNLGNEALAEEAVQETFRIACSKPADLLASPNPIGWLINTLRNTIRNTKRSCAKTENLLRAYQAAHEYDLANAEDELSLEVVYENVADTDAFKLLTEMAVEGRSHFEMAKDRGISIDACKKRVQRAKELLRRRI